MRGYYNIQHHAATEEVAPRLRSIFSRLTNYWRPEPEVVLDTAEPAEKRYRHVPTQAAAGFLATATPKHIREANEIL